MKTRTDLQSARNVNQTVFVARTASAKPLATFKYAAWQDRVLAVALGSVLLFSLAIMSAH